VFGLPGCTALKWSPVRVGRVLGPQGLCVRHIPALMDASTFTALANEFACLRARLAELELENAELRVFSKLPTTAGAMANYVSHEEADEVRDLQPEIVLPSGTYEIPTGPQQHERAVWRNREFTRYLESIGLKEKPVRSMLVTDWFKRVWFGDATHGMTRLEEAGFASIEGITVHHIVPQGLGGPDSIYNFHLVPLAVNSSFGLHFTKESVAWVGAEHAHVACEVAKFVARRAVDEFDDSKFDPFAASCPTKAVKRRRVVVGKTVERAVAPRVEEYVNTATGRELVPTQPYTPGAFAIEAMTDGREMQRCLNCNKVFGFGEDNQPYFNEANRRFNLRKNHKKSHCTHPDSKCMQKTLVRQRRVSL
jgi:hypothetical protein